MASKYIRHGETFCGDGTSSAAATVNGGDGAWNNINVFEGSAPAYGVAPTAGDVVYIRSKDAAGANITRTLAASTSLGSSAASDTAEVAWIIDNGPIWGVDGVISYQVTVETYTLTILPYNLIEALTPEAFVYVSTLANPTNRTFLAMQGALINGLLDLSVKTGGSFHRIDMKNGGRLEDTHIKFGQHSTTTYNSDGIYGVSLAAWQLVNCGIELTANCTNTTPFIWCAGSSAGGSNIEIIGGRVYGAGVASGKYIFNSSLGLYAGKVRTVGFEVPRTMQLAYPVPSLLWELEMVACDGGIGGHYERKWGYATSRSDNNPPTLSAALPDSLSSPWAWRVYPYGASVSLPMLLHSMKMYTAAPAVKTITQRLLISDTFPQTKNSLWITVEYTDAATGLTKRVSSRAYSGGALATSVTDNWTTTSWALVTCGKYKLEVTTPTSVKQDTIITVNIWGIKPSATAQDIYFIDPDFTVTT